VLLDVSVERVALAARAAPQGDWLLGRTIRMPRAAMHVHGFAGGEGAHFGHSQIMAPASCDRLASCEPGPFYKSHYQHSDMIH